PGDTADDVDLAAAQGDLAGGGAVALVLIGVAETAARHLGLGGVGVILRHAAAVALGRVAGVVGVGEADIVVDLAYVARVAAGRLVVARAKAEGADLVEDHPRAQGPAVALGGA